MTITLYNIIGIFLIGAGCLCAGIFIGAYLVFRAKSTIPGERLFGSPPKGEVFTVPYADEAPDFPKEDEKNVLKRTEEFLKKFKEDKDAGPKS